jgi:hypothetical protein
VPGSWWLRTCAVAVVAGSAATAHAVIVAADSFAVGTTPEIGEYGVGKLLEQNPACRPGWSGKHDWRGSSAQFRAVANSLVKPVIPYARGGKVQYLQTKEPAFRYVSRKLDAVPSSKTYYASFLLNPGGDQEQHTANDAHALVGFAAEIDQERFDGARALRGALVGFRWQPETGLTDLVLRCSSKNGKVEDTVLLPRVSNQTYVVVLKVNADAPKNDFISYWVNPADLTDETAATATSAAKKVLAVDCVDGPADLGRFVAVTNNWSRSFYFDEVRLGTTLADVVRDDRQALLPALAALSLIGLGLGMGWWLLRAVRRRRGAPAGNAHELS